MVLRHKESFRSLADHGPYEMIKTLRQNGTTTPRIFRPESKIVATFEVLLAFWNQSRTNRGYPVTSVPHRQEPHADR
jgi:hypothetical protein